jgi:hypothetical protein
MIFSQGGGVSTPYQHPVAMYECLSCTETYALLCVLKVLFAFLAEYVISLHFFAL